MADIAKQRVDDAITRMSNALITPEIFETDYQALTAKDLVEKYPSIFPIDYYDTESRRRGLLYGLLDAFDIPRKSPQHVTVQAITDNLRSPPDTISPTPQSISRAFGQEQVVSPHESMSTLAHALLPYIRDAILDDLVTAIQIVKGARGTV